MATKKNRRGMIPKPDPELGESKFILRDYQQEASDIGVEFLTSKKKPTSGGILVEPVGSGKSLILADIAKRLEGKVCIFQPRLELLEQNLAKYESYGDFAGVYSASANRKDIYKVTYATIGTARSHPELFKQFDYFIIDEAHMTYPNGKKIKGGYTESMYKQFFDEMNGRVLGLTASPYRMRRYTFPDNHTKIAMLNRQRPTFFNKILHVTQIGDLKKQGFFADIKYEQVDFDKSELVVNTTGSDYTEESLLIAMQHNNVNDNICSTIPKLIESGHKHILVFAPFVADAQYIADKVGGGIVHAKSNKKERRESLQKFKSGELKVMVNVGVLGIGFDFPELDTVIDAYPTMSLEKYYQRLGRLSRPHPNKKYGLVIDFCGNYDNFGKVEDMIIEDGYDGWGVYNKGQLITGRDLRDIEVRKPVKKDLTKDIPSGTLNLLYKARRFTIETEKIKTYVVVEKNNIISGYDENYKGKLQNLLYRDIDSVIHEYKDKVRIYEDGLIESPIVLDEDKFIKMAEKNPALHRLQEKFQTEIV